MTNGNSRRRRPAQNGVHAIFTSEEGWTGRVTATIGILAVAVGAALWAWTIQTSSSLTFVSLAMLFVMGGVGLSAYSLAVRRTRRENTRIRSALYELEALVEPKNSITYPTIETASNVGKTERQYRSRGTSKTLAVALFEAVLLIIAYSGLIQEYASNVNMQQWVRANVFLGGYVLNYNALFIVAGTLLGALVFQWRFGKQDRN